MQPLKILNNVQKARLLHSLLYEEIPKFLSFLTENTAHILTNREAIKAEWKEQFFTADLWFSFAEDVTRKLDRYGRELQRNSPVFAEQLFEGYNALYTVQQLINYGETAQADPKFTQAVDLLFV